MIFFNNFGNIPIKHQIKELKSKIIYKLLSMLGISWIKMLSGAKVYLYVFEGKSSSKIIRLKFKNSNNILYPINKICKLSVIPFNYKCPLLAIPESPQNYNKLQYIKSNQANSSQIYLLLDNRALLLK